jgi:hypothetical protein
MRLFKRTLSVLIVLCILMGMVQGLQIQVFAAPVPIEVRITGYNNDILTINWDMIPGAKKAVVSSDTPGFTCSNTTLVSSNITGLDFNKAYDIKVDVYSDDEGINKIGEGLVYFIPQIYFKAEIMEQQYVDISGGGREIGTKPKIGLKWNMPLVWTGNEYRFICDELNYIQNKIKAVYKNVKDLKTINFRINISSDRNLLNGDSEISSVLINYDGTGYKAKVSGNDANTVDIDFNRQTGEMALNLLGRADKNINLPDAEGINLPHEDIFPGTVYYMNIKPVFINLDSSNANTVKVGDPSAQNGSMLYGNVPYTYTPIRFMLTKDAIGNVYVRIYKVNQGSLYIPRLYYEVQLTDDPSITGDWSVKKVMDDSYFGSGVEYAVTVVSDIGTNNDVYYKVVVKSDAVSDRIASNAMPYNISQDSSRPPIPQDVRIVDRELVTREINEADGTKTTQKSTNVTISWLKPDNWNEIIGNSDPDSEIYYHILLNTYQSDQNIQPPPVLEADGVNYGRFPAVNRLVRYISAKSSNIKVNGNRLEYVLEGFELFKGEDADGICDEQLANQENYPDMLLPNKVYYIQMYTTKGADNKGSADPADMSDKSVPVSFTTLSGIYRDVPVPKNLKLNKNAIDKVEVPGPHESNYLELQFDKVSIDWSYYSDKNDLKGQVYYDIYMSTRTELNSFICIGTTENLNGDLQFSGLNDISTAIKFTVRNFTSQELVNRFGYGIRPNTTYYLMVRTRLKTDEGKEFVSMYTSILPVTTIRGSIIERVF